MQAAFGSPDLPAIMADVPKFTALLTPTFGRMAPL